MWETHVWRCQRSTLLADRGFALTLVGRSWAKPLFSAYPWKVVSLSGSRIQALRDTHVDSGLPLTNSFSTALEFRLAGISAIGYARDARSWLLRKAIAVDTRDHMVEYYHRLARALVGSSPRFRATSDCASASLLDSMCRTCWPGTT